MTPCLLWQITQYPKLPKDHQCLYFSILKDHDFSPPKAEFLTEKCVWSREISRIPPPQFPEPVGRRARQSTSTLSWYCELTWNPDKCLITVNSDSGYFSPKLYSDWHPKFASVHIGHSQPQMFRIHTAVDLQQDIPVLLRKIPTENKHLLPSTRKMNHCAANNLRFVNKNESINKKQPTSVTWCECSETRESQIFASSPGDYICHLRFTM